MSYRAPLFAVAFLLFGCIGGGEEEVDQPGSDYDVARIFNLIFTEPPELAAMVDWPEGGVQLLTDAVLILGAADEPNGTLTVYGGLGHHLDEDRVELDQEHGFSVTAEQSPDGLRTQPLDLQVLLNGSGSLNLVGVTLFELQLDRSTGVPLVTRGKLVGVISRETAIATVVPRLNMTVDEYFDHSGVAPNFDLDAQPGDDAWVAVADFTMQFARLQ